jgi:hypothetical protein
MSKVRSTPCRLRFDGVDETPIPAKAAAAAGAIFQISIAVNMPIAEVGAVEICRFECSNLILP